MRSPPASFSFKGQAPQHTTVKLSIVFQQEIKLPSFQTSSSVLKAVIMVNWQEVKEQLKYFQSSR